MAFFTLQLCRLLHCLSFSTANTTVRGCTFGYLPMQPPYLPYTGSYGDMPPAYVVAFAPCSRVRRRFVLQLVDGADCCVIAGETRLCSRLSRCCVPSPHLLDNVMVGGSAGPRGTVPYNAAPALHARGLPGIYFYSRAEARTSTLGTVWVCNVLRTLRRTFSCCAATILLRPHHLRATVCRRRAMVPVSTMGTGRATGGV